MTPEVGGAPAHPLHLAADWSRAGRDVAVASVIQTWGSSPCPPGSLMVVDADGDFAGSVSGGCIESEVVLAAAEAIAGGDSRILEFGVDHDAAWSLGLTCGGRMRVLVQPVTDEGRGMSRARLKEIDGAVAAERPLALCTALDDFSQVWFEADDDTAAASLNAEVVDAAAERLRTDRSGTVTAAGREWFVHALNPPPTLAVMGAVHIAQPLARMSVIAGLRVAVIDPRRAFAESGNLAGVAVHAAWPEEALPELDTGAGVALATLTHEPRLDDAALAWALNEHVFYIGALGSRKTHAARLERLRKHGFDEDALARIRGPIGLSIGAVTPAEIAASILGEVIAARRGASA